MFLEQITTITLKTDKQTLHNSNSTTLKLMPSS